MATQRSSSIIPIAVAIVAMVALFGWLATRPEPETVAVAEPGDTTAVDSLAPETGRDVPADSLANTAFVRGALGQPITVANLPVSTAMGRHFFWVDLPNGQPLLVKLDSALVAANTAPPTSGQVTVTGVLQSKDDALLSQWLQQGVLESEGHQMQASFGSSYLAARRVQPAGS